MIPKIGTVEVSKKVFEQNSKYITEKVFLKIAHQNLYQSPIHKSK